MNILAPWLLGVFGLMFGSFLNVCISRLPRGESVVFPRSRCPRCRAAIGWYDNIPVLSYLWLAGRCRACRERISVRYPIVEVATAALFFAQAEVCAGDGPLLLSRLVLTALLITLFGTDLETHRLPDRLTIVGIAAGLLSSVALAPGLRSSLIGLALGAGLLLTIRWLWSRLAGVEAMGLGDVKMLAMIGAFLGWEQVCLVLLLASVAGAAVGLSLTATGKASMQSRLPFGTFLAAAAIASSLVGGDILRWYSAFYR